MTGATEFYQLRDQRTAEFLPGGFDYEAPVHIATDPSSMATAAGQVLLLSLVNQVARAFRRVTIDLSADAPNHLPSIAIGETLSQAVLQLAQRIDPYGAFSIGPPPSPARVTLGVGDPATPCDWYLGADRAVATLDRHPAPLRGDLPGSVRGACLASCLGAAAAFRAVLGVVVLPRRLSIWNCTDGDNADPGPDDLVPVDVGTVLIIGAGAVASGLVHWLRLMGVTGEWVVVDRDQVQLHNTNRSLLFFPDHARWPSGAGERKAEILAAALPGCRAVPKWYDECTEADLSRPDVILSLANGRSVRAAIANLNHVLVLHATTSRDWGSLLHRHIAGRDDCPACRHPETAKPIFACSTAKITPTPENVPSADAALPFLSAASGLMLAVALQRLQAGELARDPMNSWRWAFDSEREMMAWSGHQGCSKDCNFVLPPTVCRRINAGTRWAHLDEEGVQ